MSVAVRSWTLSTFTTSTGMPTRVQHKVAVAFALALLVLVAIAGASYRGIRQLQQAYFAERQSSAILGGVATVDQVMTEAETGLRGYLLVGDPRYLTPYWRAVQSLPRIAGNLRTSAHPEDSLRVAHALGLMQRKADILAETIATWDRGDSAGALAIVRTSRGLALMDSLRTDLDSLRGIERERLSDRQAIAEAAVENVGLIITLGVLVAFAVAAFATGMVARDEQAREFSRRALERAREAAEMANRAKDDFVSRTSHELRTPLNSIIGFSNVLLRNKRQALDAQELTYLERIKSSGTHLLAIINDILDLSKVESGRMDVHLAPVDVLALVREIADSFSSTVAGRNVELVLDLPGPLAPVSSDVDRLRQVLTNLLANALKFTERGLVVVRVIPDAGGVHPWRLDVIDSGIGVAPSRQAAIFGAFEQAENTISRRFGGTGLGLAISKSMCERLGYGLTVVSRDGVGSTFSVLFNSAAKPPLRHEPPAAA